MPGIRLLVLGAVPAGAVRRHGRPHGYQVRGDLEYRGAREWSNAEPGSIRHAPEADGRAGTAARARDRAVHGRWGPGAPRAEALELLPERIRTAHSDAVRTHGLVDSLEAGACTVAAARANPSAW